MSAAKFISLPLLVAFVLVSASCVKLFDPDKGSASAIVNGDFHEWKLGGSRYDLSPDSSVFVIELDHSSDDNPPFQHSISFEIDDYDGEGIYTPTSVRVRFDNGNLSFCTYNSFLNDNGTASVIITRARSFNISGSFWMDSLTTTCNGECFPETVEAINGGFNRIPKRLFGSRL